MDWLRLLKFAAVICLPGVLLGCQTTNPDYGTGPIHVSTKAQNFIKRVNNGEFYPEDIAISIDGKSAGASICPVHAQCGGGDAELIAINSCQKYSKGVPCKVFMSLGDIVWKGKITYE